MKQPTFEYEGNEYPVIMMDWYSDGRVFSVSFYDRSGLFYTSYNKMEHETESCDQSGNLNLDLNKRLKKNKEDE